MWETAQRTGPTQRRGRYLPDSTRHPARMLPAIAAHAIHTYTRPGEPVFDPMCGIGTTLVEAVHAGRDALGVEYEPRWAQVADANLAHARTQGARRAMRSCAGSLVIHGAGPSYRGSSAGKSDLEQDPQGLDAVSPGEFLPLLPAPGPVADRHLVRPYSALE